MNIAATVNTSIPLGSCEMCKTFRLISCIDDTNLSYEDTLLSCIQHFLNTYSCTKTKVELRRQAPPKLEQLLAAMHASYLIASHEGYKETHKNCPDKTEVTLNTPIIDCIQKYKPFIEPDFQQDTWLIKHGQLVEICYSLLSDTYQLEVVYRITENLKFLGVLAEDKTMLGVSSDILNNIKNTISQTNRPDSMLCYPIIRAYSFLLRKLQILIKAIGVLIICAVLTHTPHNTLHSTLDNWERIRPQGMEKRHKLAQELTEQLKTLFPPIYYDANSQGKAAPAPQRATS